LGKRNISFSFCSTIAASTNKWSERNDLSTSALNRHGVHSKGVRASSVCGSVLNNVDGRLLESCRHECGNDKKSKEVEGLHRERESVVFFVIRKRN
jgi:hypothetical protein